MAISHGRYMINNNAKPGLEPVLEGDSASGRHHPPHHNELHVLHEVRQRLLRGSFFLY